MLRLGTATYCQFPAVWDFKADGNPFATFFFKYRTRGELSQFSHLN